MLINVLGVPDSAGAYCLGVEQAPTALRTAGLVAALTAAGHPVHDAGDLTERHWRPDRSPALVENLEQEVAAATELAAAAAPLLAHGDRLLTLGGSCTIAIGLCAAMAADGRVPRLVYVDRHLDLNTPDTTREASLSWMGLAHCLDVAGARAELAGLSDRRPLLEPQNVALLGTDLSQTTEGERRHLADLGLPVVTQQEWAHDPQGAAQSTLSALGPGAFLVHLDVDVLDFLAAPLAENVNGRNSGPDLAQLQQSLSTLWAHPDCLGLSIGQLVPAHAAADPSALPAFVAMLAEVAGRPEVSASARP